MGEQKHCTCDQSCEPHIHDGDYILCLHDGEEDHSHCPQATGFPVEMECG